MKPPAINRKARRRAGDVSPLVTSQARARSVPLRCLRARRPGGHRDTRISPAGLRRPLAGSNLQRRSLLLFLFCFTGSFTVVVSARAADKPADLVLRGGVIVTVDDDHPQAEALAARG